MMVRKLVRQRRVILRKKEKVSRLNEEEEVLIRFHCGYEPSDGTGGVIVFLRETQEFQKDMMV